MGHVVEHQGRLVRTDGREVAAGRFDLRFRLHLHREGPALVWEELHPGVRVSVGGAYSVLLGAFEDLEAQHFNEPRWLGIYVEREGVSTEVGERVQLAGTAVRLEEGLLSLHARLDAADAHPPRALSAAAGGDVPARKRIVTLHRRVKRLEAGGAVAPLAERLRLLEARLARLDDEERGRVIHLEDELDDLVGRDGDLIDLTERIEALEKGHGGPMRLARPDAEIEARAEAAEAQTRALRRELSALQAEVAALAERVAHPPAPPPAPPLPEVLPGPLTVQRGGLHVAGGGLVVHDVEGRLAGASKREGTLLVNSRAGGDVLVGNKESGSVAVTVSLRAARAIGVSRTLAIRLGGDAAPGDVVVLDSRKKAPTVRLAAPGEAPLGVVVERAGVELGEGAVVVAIAGLVRVRVVGAVAAGAWLEAGEAGAARAGEGPGLGRALAAVGGDGGGVEVVLGR